MKKICEHWSWGILAVFFLFGCFVYAQPALNSNPAPQAKGTQIVAQPKAHSVATSEAKDAVDSSERRLMFYITETVGFYKWMISLLLSVIAAVLAVGYYFSSKRAEEMAHKALKEETFKLALDKMVQDKLTLLFNNSNLATMETTVSEISNKIVGLEKQISANSYKIVDTEGGDA